MKLKYDNLQGLFSESRIPLKAQKALCSDMHLGTCTELAMDHHIRYFCIKDMFLEVSVLIGGSTAELFLTLPLLQHFYF